MKKTSVFGRFKKQLIHTYFLIDGWDADELFSL